jgi:stage III sporulation protein SpoIIIAA
VPQFAPEVAWVEEVATTESVHAIKDILEKIVD